MRISELSELTGVTIATLKYYLREGLLPAGASLGATRADYGEAHVTRVRLIRTLVDVGGLGIERVREVVSALENPPETRHALLGTAHAVLDPNPGPHRAPPGTCDTGAAAAERALHLADALGWRIDRHSTAATQLTRAIERAEAAGWDLPDDRLGDWARAMREIAEDDVPASLGEATSADALRHAIIGNVLTDPVVIGLRRLAQEAISAERLQGRPAHQR